MKKFQKDFANTNSLSDKIHHHGYHRFYPWFLEHLRHESINVLEIGIDKTESLKLWTSYFDKVNLYGIDIDPKAFEDKTVQIYRVDQSNAEELDSFVKDVGIQFDVILDDGSHVPDHQMLTLEKIWTVLKPSGVYIVEDIETSYWGNSQIYGYRFNSNLTSIIKEFKKLIDVVNSEFSKKKSKNKYLGNIADEIEMITFAYNCIILVKKDYDSFSNYYDRKYINEGQINYNRNLPLRIVRKLRSVFGL